MDSVNFQNFKSISYPQYRKYSNNKTYFKIISEDEWEEIQIVGAKTIVTIYKVKIFPDRNYLNDLTFEYQNNYLKIEKEEYENLKKSIK